MQLVQVDAVDLQAAQAGLAGGTQVLGTAIALPCRPIGPHDAALRRDEHALGIRVQRFGDQHLADFGAVRIGGIDEQHPQLVGALQQVPRLAGIVGLTPDAFPGDAHRAESETRDAQVTNGDRSDARKVQCRHRHVSWRCHIRQFRSVAHGDHYF